MVVFGVVVWTIAVSGAKQLRFRLKKDLRGQRLNYKFKKITFKNIQIHGLSDFLAKRVKILDGMKCSLLFAPISLDTWKSEIQLSSGIIITVVVLAVL